MTISGGRVRQFTNDCGESLVQGLMVRVVEIEACDGSNIFFASSRRDRMTMPLPSATAMSWPCNDPKLNSSRAAGKRMTLARIVAVVAITHRKATFDRPSAAKMEAPCERLTSTKPRFVVTRAAKARE